MKLKVVANITDLHPALKAGLLELKASINIFDDRTTGREFLLELTKLSADQRKTIFEQHVLPKHLEQANPVAYKAVFTCLKALNASKIDAILEAMNRHIALLGFSGIEDINDPTPTGVIDTSQRSVSPRRESSGSILQFSPTDKRVEIGSTLLGPYESVRKPSIYVDVFLAWKRVEPWQTRENSQGFIIIGNGPELGPFGLIKNVNVSSDGTCVSFMDQRKSPINSTFDYYVHYIFQGLHHKVFGPYTSVTQPDAAKQDYQTQGPAGASRGTLIMRNLPDVPDEWLPEA